MYSATLRPVRAAVFTVEER